jgi:hypothetical protein
MGDLSTEPKLLLPGLAPLYRHTVPFSWLVVRLAAGLILFYHGTGKIGHVDAVTANMIKNGIPLSLSVLAAYTVIISETIGRSPSRSVFSPASSPRLARSILPSSPSTCCGPKASFGRRAAMSSC